MLDSNVFDALLEDAQMLEDLRRGVTTGSVEILVTHVQVDEIVDTIGPDPERLKQLLHTLLRSGAHEVSTYGIVLDHSSGTSLASPARKTVDASRHFNRGIL